MGALVTVAALVAPKAASASTTQSPAPLGPTILIGTGGLTWGDVSPQATPTLWSFVRDGASASMSIQSVYASTCPVDGWLGLSAGDRAAARRPGGGCPDIPEVDGGFVPGWSAYVQTAAATKYDARLGTLGESLAGSGQCIQAVGPGAGVGAAYTSGAVPRYAPFDPSALTALLSRCRVTLVDVGSVTDHADHAAQVAQVDRRIAQVAEAAPTGSNLVVASLADAGTTPRLGLVVAKGPDFGSGMLASSSTRQVGLVQSADLPVTLLAAAGAEVPAGFGGAVLHRDAADANSTTATTTRLRALRDTEQASHEVTALVPPFFYGLVGLQLVLYLLGAVAWRLGGSSARRLQALELVRRVATVAAAVPVSTFLANLVPWWRFTPPMVALVAAVAVFTAVIGAVALLGPWSRHPAGPTAAVCLVTLVVLGADVLLGSHLQLSSLLGLQPAVGGRYYGVGNVTFALLATAGLFLAIALSGEIVVRRRPRVAAAVALAVGLVTVVIDGAPFWGADGGGPPALLPGLAYLVMAILGIRITWKRALVVGAGTAGAFLLVAFLDWLRPPASRSHLGRFFGSVIGGGGGDIISRKLDQNVSILLSTPLAMLVPVGLVVAVVVLARQSSRAAAQKPGLPQVYEDCPTLLPGLVALLVVLVIGFAINDSGVAIPANAALIALPCLIAMSVRSAENTHRAAATTRATRRGSTLRAQS